MSIPLISLNGERNDALHGSMKSTPALQLCEYIQHIMATFDEAFSRPLFACCELLSSVFQRQEKRKVQRGVFNTLKSPCFATVAGGHVGLQ